MAWVAEALFDSLSDGDLNGQGGGSGWTGNWSGSGNFDIQGSVVYQGAKAVINGGGSNIERQLAADVNGSSNILYVAVRKSSASAGGLKVRLNNTTDNIRVQIEMNSSGNIVARTSSPVTILTGYSANTWYVFRITLNVSLSTYKVAYATGAYGSAGTFSADSSDISMESSGDIRYVQFDSDSGNNNYWDYISPTTPFVSTDPPTVDTAAATAITHNSATLNGEITDVGVDDCDERGFVWSETSEADPGDTAPGDSDYTDYENETGTFSADTFDYDLSSLTPNTTYYVRAYAHNSDGYAYGDEISFDTDTAPTFRFTNLPGIVFDEVDTTTIYAERLNEIIERIEALE